MTKESVVAFLENMVKAEESIVNSLNDSLIDVNNLVVKSALKGISLDSTKHAELYDSAITLLTEQRLPIDEKQLDKQSEILERHITMEENLINTLEKKIPEIKDEKVTFLLNAILTDEKRHHKLLKKLHEILVKGETVTEEEWWNAIWKDVPGLWT